MGSRITRDSGKHWHSGLIRKMIATSQTFGEKMTVVHPQAQVHQAARIVIVDDSTANLKLYAKLAAGVEPDVGVHSFNDPRKALEWLGDNVADLVISDYKMPAMDGAEFTRRVRWLPTCPNVPVVVVTAHADHDFRIAALEAGASDFLRSPVDYLEFQTRARNLLRLGRHQRLMRNHAFTLEHDLKESEKSREQLLRDNEASLERAQEIAKIGSWEMDVATGEAVWSKQLHRMRGLPLDFKPTSENAASHVHAADIQLQADWLADLTAGVHRDPIEVRIRLPDGEERVNRLEGRPVIDPDGLIRRVAGTAQDITERRLIESALAQSQKMDAIGQLTGGMAHDFNNMLGVVIGNLDLLKPLVGADVLASELCAEARDGAIRCADLIRRLLAFARRQPLRPEQTDVNALTHDLSRLLGRTLGEHVTLTLDLSATLWPVKLDASQLEAALINLATNARDAMPKGGQLTIATRNVTLDASYTAQYPDMSAGDYALIEICDTGTGIPPEIITRIFDPFFTTKACGKGTGLGLSMAFGFVKQSGGHLSVYSEPGLGTTFRLYLPRCDGGETVSPDAPSSDEIVGGDETILVVEDNAQLRCTAERQLAKLGYTVREANSALPALALLSGREKVDLLFTDVVMPGTMDGLDLAYRATRLRQGLRVLLTSGFPSGRGGDQRMAHSPFRLLDKPYSLRELAQAVRMELDKAGNGVELTPLGHETGPVEGPSGR